MNFLDSKINKIVILVISTLTTGTLGYMVISGYSFVDAIYMTVITVTTVGFGEVKPFTPEEKIFTIFLILTSIVLFGYAVSTFSEYLVSGRLFDYFKHKRVEKKIAKLKGHTIVCGYGRNGRQAIVKLKNYNKQFVIVERNKEVVQKLESEEYLCINNPVVVFEHHEKFYDDGKGLDYLNSLLATCGYTTRRVYGNVIALKS